MLIAVAGERDIGVDLEQVRDKVEVVALAERFYASAEYQRVLSLSGSDQARQFYRYWVAKEAVLKGQGVGLLSLRQCEILTAEIPSRAVAQVFPGSAMRGGWTIQWVDCGDGWVGALSAHGSDWEVRAMTV
jgi:4'-phosphopantetheinyl transferase